MRRLGLTLIEVLLVIAIMGILLGAFTRVVTGTLTTTSLATSQSDLLISLKDAVGYVSDQIRASTVVFQSITIDGTSCSSSSTTTPCFGVQQAVLDSSGNPVTNSYQIKVFRIRARSNLSSSYKSTDSWADSNTYYIEEYRVSCTTACPTNGGSVSGGSWYFVADDLTLTDSSGGTISPFTILTNSSSVRNGVTITVRTTARISGRQIYVPYSSTYSVTVRSRNI